MPQANQRISEYLLDQRVGAGGSGEVWRARHHIWPERVVAIKFPTLPQYIRQLQREGMAVQRLSHPSIVRVIGFDPYADQPYLVMDYVPGTNLRPWIESGSLLIEDTVAVMKIVLAALSHAHLNGVVHRDVKPENILIHDRARDDGFEKPGMVMLTDFGMGMDTTTITRQSIAFSNSLTREDGLRMMGTIDYMAPEQREAKEVGPSADLYACGIVLYEMLTGQKPVGMESPRELNANVPRYLDDVFRRAYVRLEKRFKSAEEFLKALDGSRKFLSSGATDTGSGFPFEMGVDLPSSNMLRENLFTAEYAADEIDNDSLIDDSASEPIATVIPQDAILQHETDILAAISQESRALNRTSRMAVKPSRERDGGKTPHAGWAIGGAIVGILWAILNDRLAYAPAAILIGAAIGQFISVHLSSGSQ